MYIIVSKNINKETRKKLSGIGDVIEFESKNVVYKGIENHPDIFMCQIDGNLIVAPETPEPFLEKLFEKEISYIIGSKKLGKKYPDSTHYNVLVTKEYIIHHRKYTDTEIINHSAGRKPIHVNQAYTRCNTIGLNDNFFITSDKGIENELKKEDLKVLYINPESIKLEHFPVGFFGGCCGIFQNKLFVHGNITKVQPAGIIEFVERAGVEIISLNQQPLVDIGGIFFIESKK